MTGYQWRSADVSRVNATISAVACVSLLRLVTPASITAEVERLKAVGLTGRARHLEAALGQMRLVIGLSGSDLGTSEVPIDGAAGGSSRPLLLGTGLTAKQVALELGCSEEYVRRLCRDGKLRSDLVGGQWVIDPDAVDEELTRRRNR